MTNRTKSLILLSLALLCMAAGAWLHSSIFPTEPAPPLAATPDTVHVYHTRSGAVAAEAAAKVLTAQQAAHTEEVKAMRKEVGRLSNLVILVNAKLAQKGEISAALRDTALPVAVSPFAASRQGGGPLADSSAIAAADSLAPPDSVRLKSFSWHDRWLSVNGLLNADSIRIKYRLEHDLSVSADWVRMKPAGPLALRVNFLSANPSVVPESLKSIFVQAQKVFFQTRGFAFGIGFAVGTLVAAGVAAGVTYAINHL